MSAMVMLNARNLRGALSQRFVFEPSTAQTVTHGVLISGMTMITVRNPSQPASGGAKSVSALRCIAHALGFTH